MRNDHHAYQRAARVAGFGLLLQLVIGLTLLLFGLLSVSGGVATTYVYGAMYVLLGGLVWLSLIIVFYQHKLERLEALEHDELAASRATGEAGSMFDESEEQSRVAARRLRLMHRWLMPIISLLLVVALGLLGWWMMTQLAGVESGETAFNRTPLRGWGVSICLAIAVASFIFSRFVAGMAKVEAWQNLRGGAGYMVGNALVGLAIAIGTAFRFFDNEQVIVYIAYAIPIFMFVLAAEIVLNFILNIYRPRVVGETPRPAFDSRLLSLVSTPDSIVRTINEAVNYQFGFDITSSWGYQLLLRSFAWLVVIAAVVLVGLNMMVVVEPHQQAVKLAGGDIVGSRVYSSGVMWKLPWPLQTAEVYDVTRVRELPLTAQQQFDDYEVSLWEAELETDIELDPFIVSAAKIEVDPEISERMEELEPLDISGTSVDMDTGAGLDDAPADDEVSEEVVRNFALIDAILSMHYRIKSTQTGSDTNGLLDYLRFAPDIRRPRETLTDREKALKDLALREISLYFTRVPLNELLYGSDDARAGLVEELRRRVQSAFDRHNTGIEVVAIIIPEMRPAGSGAGNFVDLTIAKQQRRERISQAQQRRITTLTYRAGSPEDADEIIDAIDQYDQLKREHGPDHPETVAQRLEVEAMLDASGGAAITEIIKAERDRWVQVMAERARVSRVIGELPAYRAAPELYREREIMAVFKDNLDGVRKFIIGTDPSIVNMDVEFKELSPYLGISPQDVDGDGTTE